MVGAVRELGRERGRRGAAGRIVRLEFATLLGPSCGRPALCNGRQLLPILLRVRKVGAKLIAMLLLLLLAYLCVEIGQQLLDVVDEPIDPHGTLGALLGQSVGRRLAPELAGRRRGQAASLGRAGLLLLLLLVACVRLPLGRLSLDHFAMGILSELAPRR